MNGSFSAASAVAASTLPDSMTTGMGADATVALEFDVATSSALLDLTTNDALTLVYAVELFPQPLAH